MLCVCCADDMAAADALSVPVMDEDGVTLGTSSGSSGMVSGKSGTLTLFQLLFKLNYYILLLPNHGCLQPQHVRCFQLFSSGALKMLGVPQECHKMSMEEKAVLGCGQVVIGGVRFNTSVCVTLLQMIAADSHATCSFWSNGRPLCIQSQSLRRKRYRNDLKQKMPKMRKMRLKLSLSSRLGSC